MKQGEKLPIDLLMGHLVFLEWLLDSSKKRFTI